MKQHLRKIIEQELSEFEWDYSHIVNEIRTSTEFHRLALKIHSIRTDVRKIVEQSFTVDNYDNEHINTQEDYEKAFDEILNQLLEELRNEL